MALGQCNVEEVGSGVFVFLPLRAAETVRLSFSLSPCTVEGETLFSFPRWSLRLKFVGLSTKRNAGAYWLVRKMDGTSRGC